MENTYILVVVAVEDATDTKEGVTGMKTESAAAVMAKATAVADVTDATYEDCCRHIELEYGRFPEEISSCASTFRIRSGWSGSDRSRQ